MTYLVPKCININSTHYDYERTSVSESYSRDNKKIRQGQRGHQPLNFHHKNGGEVGSQMSSVCKYCSEEIFWKQSAKSGKWYAVDNEADKTSFHSNTCTGREAEAV